MSLASTAGSGLDEAAGGQERQPLSQPPCSNCLERACTCRAGTGSTGRNFQCHAKRTKPRCAQCVQHGERTLAVVLHGCEGVDCGDSQVPLHPTLTESTRSELSEHEFGGGEGETEARGGERGRGKGRAGGTRARTHTIRHGPVSEREGEGGREGGRERHAHECPIGTHIHRAALANEHQRRFALCAGTYLNPIHRVLYLRTSNAR